MLRPLLVFFSVLLLCFPAKPACAGESVRTAEIFQCRPDELVTWGDGTDRRAVSTPLKFAYNPAGAPSWFSEKQVAGMITLAAAAWSQCGVPGQRVAWDPGPKRLPGVVVVQWSQEGSGGNFGLANYRLRTLSLGPKAFELLRARGPSYDAGKILQMVISHEMGHLFGLMAHSRRCVDVMSYYNNGRGENCISRDFSQVNLNGVDYRNDLPTACDIQRCRQANGFAPLPDGRLGKAH
jgi:hypothetical protein